MTGVLVIAPPGTGKTYWLQQNPDSKWEEGDDLYPPKYRQTERSLDDLRELERMNNTWKAEGKYILTGDWYVLEGVDGIVVPKDLDQVRLNIEKSGRRPGHNVQKCNDLLLEHRGNIPTFASVEEAVEAFT